MIQNEKFRKIDQRKKVYTGIGVATNLLGILPSVKKNQKINTALTCMGCGASVASIINYIRSLEKYDMSDESEEHIFLKEFLLDFIASTTVDSLMLGWSLSSNDRKKKILKKLNVPDNIVNILV